MQRQIHSRKRRKLMCRLSSRNSHLVLPSEKDVRRRGAQKSIMNYNRQWAEMSFTTRRKLMTMDIQLHQSLKRKDNKTMTFHLWNRIEINSRASDLRTKIAEEGLQTLAHTPLIRLTQSTSNLRTKLSVKSIRSTMTASQHWIWVVHKQSRS